MDFSPDITEFVRLRFGAEQYQQVIDILRSPALSTPRVMRSVLYLSNGSLSMLKHYRAEAEKDVRMILVEAEYITNVSADPLFIRDMSTPFSDERNLGPKQCPAHNADAAAASDARVNHRQASHHKNIWGETFYLGEVKYTIMDYQTSRSYVYCQRQTSHDVRVKRLPLMFVLEQLAERFEMAPIGFAAVQ